MANDNTTRDPFFAERTWVPSGPTPRFQPKPKPKPKPKRKSQAEWKKEAEELLMRYLYIRNFVGEPFVDASQIGTEPVTIPYGMNVLTESGGLEPWAEFVAESYPRGPRPEDIRVIPTQTEALIAARRK